MPDFTSSGLLLAYHCDELVGLYQISSLFFKQIGSALKAVSQNMFSTSQATGQQTILVVEDYVDAREMMKTMLELMGYRVVQAADGPEAIEVAKRERPTAILMDMSLPAMDGYETTKRLRELPEFKLTTIIACTAYNRWEWRAKAIAAGCNGFLAKPLDVTSLKVILSSSTGH